MRRLAVPALALVAAALAPRAARADVPPSSSRIAPDKFIPSFAIMYGSAMPGAPVDELARFDVVISTSTLNKRWASGSETSWQALKALHPTQLTFLYVMGPAEYNTASWGQFTEGWSWMMTNHGIGTSDPWIARGLHVDGMLQNPGYANEELMLPGNAAWEAYWADRAYTLAFTSPPAPGEAGADGIFSDNTTAGDWVHWVDQSTTTEDPPEAYAAPDGGPRDDLWRADILRAMGVAIPSLAAHGAAFVPNYGGMGFPGNNWAALEAMATPPKLALQEDGFVSPYGDKPGAPPAFHSWSFDAKVRELASLKIVRALMTNHGLGLVSPASRDAAVAQMTTADANGLTGWDALWFSMGAFLLGFDDVRGNALFYFTIWNGDRMVYFDELDPHALHLGHALGPFTVTGGVYAREFDDGWIAVNPTLFTQAPPGTTLHFSVPSGTARVVTHDDLADPSGAPLVAGADIPAGHAIILLKPGHAIGDSDNGAPDAGVAADAGTGMDAGVGPAPVPVDAGAVDGGGGAGAAPSSDGSSGCGCHVAHGASPAFAAPAALAALALLRRRKRRQRSG